MPKLKIRAVFYGNTEVRTYPKYEKSLLLRKGLVQYILIVNYLVLCDLLYYKEY